MAVLSRDDFFNRVQASVGTDASDETMSFIEDMTDTYNDLENRATGDGEDWRKKYEELDASWRERYKRRFFTGKSELVVDNTEDMREDRRAEEITVDDLFKETLA